MSQEDGDSHADTSVDRLDPEAAIESPFEDGSRLTDVTFLVEGKALHFCRPFLAASSPVFEKMFSSDFREKESSAIPLPDKTLEEMAVFLQQFHPSHSWKPLNDDILETLLRLADEYQADHVRQKCQFYITTQIETNATPEAVLQMSAGSQHRQLPPQFFRSDLDLDQVLLYLHLCDEYHLPKSRQELIQLASGRSLKTLQKHPIYKKLCDGTKLEMMTARCLWLESR